MEFNIEHTFSESDRFSIGVDFHIMKNGETVSEDIKAYFIKQYLEIAKGEVQGDIEEQIGAGKHNIGESGYVEFTMKMEYFLPGQEDLLEEEFQFRAEWQILKNLTSMKKDVWDLTYSDMISWNKEVSGKASVSVLGYKEEDRECEDNEQAAFEDVIDSIHDEIENGETSGTINIMNYGVDYQIEWSAE